MEMNLIVPIVVIIAMAVINRFRGGGIIPVAWFDPPGHRRFWATPLVASVAALWLSPLMAIAFGLCWLVWALLPWGRWYTCGRGYREWSGQPNPFENAIEVLSCRVTGFDASPYRRPGYLIRILDDHLCLAMRNMFALAPLAYFSQLAAIIVLVGMAIAYELAWRMFDEEDGPTGVAEVITGMVWGLALLAM